MIIALDDWKFVADKWHGIEIDVAEDPEGTRFLVCDVPFAANVNAPEACVERFLKEQGKFDTMTRSDVVDAICHLYEP